MAGGKDGFLNEQTGDFVLFLRGAASITSIVGAGSSCKIYSSMARQGQDPPYLVYVMGGGHSEKDGGGVEGCDDINLHVYAYGATDAQSQALAVAVRDRMLPTQAIVGDGTKLLVCNGGIVNKGVDTPKDGSDRKRYWTRLVLRMVVSD